MKNVLFVESGKTGGGSFESLYQFLKNLNRSEINPHVVFINHTKYYEKIQDLNIPCYLIFDFLYNRKLEKSCPLIGKVVLGLQTFVDLHLPFMSLFINKIIHVNSIREIIKIIKTYRIDIVHTNNQVCRDLYVVECARKSNIHCVAHLRSFFSFRFNRVMANFSNKNVSCFIAYSKAVADHWIALGVDKEKIEVIHNAIEMKDVTPFNRDKILNLPKDSKLIGIVGKIIPERGHEFLLNAFADIVALRSDLYLLIVGGGEKKYVLQLKGYMKELNISSNVIFIGEVSNAKEVIVALDLLVLPYSIEPFGRVMLEAWLLRTPVVLSDIGSIQDIVSDTQDALLFEYNNKRQLKDSILLLIDNKQMREKIVENAYKKCIKSFSIHSHSKRIYRVYNSIVI